MGLVFHHRVTVLAAEHALVRVHDIVVGTLAASVDGAEAMMHDTDHAIASVLCAEYTRRFSRIVVRRILGATFVEASLAGDVDHVLGSMSSACDRLRLVRCVVVGTTETHVMLTRAVLQIHHRGSLVHSTKSCRVRRRDIVIRESRTPLDRALGMPLTSHALSKRISLVPQGGCCRRNSRAFRRPFFRNRGLLYGRRRPVTLSCGALRHFVYGMGGNLNEYFPIDSF